MAWNLRGGVLIIGSLLWQKNLTDDDTSVRLDWRNGRLDLENRIYIKAPIRYGRKSKDGITTMIFSNKMKNKKGFCYVIPFKKAINNKDELLCEAISLSCAEGMKGNFVRRWGVLTYLFNNTIDNDAKKAIVQLFRKRKKNKKFDIEEYKVSGEKNCLTKSLKLNIDWPEPVLEKDKDLLNKFHFLLATATKPQNPAPNLSEISESVKSDMKRMYFINNMINGIITAEDFEISKLL
ncbi:MAG: hypothetical protein PF690_00385 [Deltaproteobacteria bacterium]|jgi:hypothetical protein|nr:hypothetical protein [Deltaproteobacteria bacterium]